jgi:hypothetical protein
LRRLDIGYYAGDKFMISEKFRRDRGVRLRSKRALVQR